MAPSQSASPYRSPAASPYKSPSKNKFFRHPAPEAMPSFGEPAQSPIKPRAANTVRFEEMAPAPLHPPASPSVTVSAPRKALRVVLQQDYPSGKPQDVGDFAAAAQEEIASVLGLPANSLQVLYVFGDGSGNVAIDISLCGSVWGQEAVAAAQLAAYVSRGGVASVKSGAENEGFKFGGQQKRAMLVGAEVQLLLGTPWEEVPPAISSPRKAQKDMSWDAHKPRPQLDPEVQKLLDDAGRLVKNRPAANSRLKMLEDRQKQRAAVRKLEDRWWARKERRLMIAAKIIQKQWRGRRVRRMVWLQQRQLAAQKIQAFYRGYRLRRRIFDVKRRMDAIVVIQAWWRGCLARWRLYRMLGCLQSFWRCVVAKIMALELKSWFLRRRRACICIQTRYRGYLARRELKRLRILRREKVELALWIQSCFIGRLEGEKLQEEFKAAVTIQSAWRQYVVRLWARQLYREQSKKGTGKALGRMMVAVQGDSMKRPITQAQIEQERREAEERRRRAAQKRKEEEERSKRAVERAQHGEGLGGGLVAKVNRAEEERAIAARMIQQAWRLRKVQRGRAEAARLKVLERKIGKKAVAHLPDDLKRAYLRGELDESGWEVEDISEYEDEEEVKTFNAWDKRLLSDFVELSHKDVRATHKDLTGEELQGVVYGNGPLPMFKEGDYYFEVEVTRTTGDLSAPDGLVMGITTRNPWKEQKLYMVGDDVPDSWSIGYDGMTNSPSKRENKIDFKTATLEKGDRMGILVTKKLEIFALHNDKFVAEIEGDRPSKKDILYPYIDLLGNTKGVHLLVDIPPPEYKKQGEEEQGYFGWLLGGTENQDSDGEPAEGDAEKAAAKEKPMRFHPGLASRWVQISEDGMNATSIDTSRNELFGVVFGTKPLKREERGLYFEVQIQEVVHGCDDAMAIGVTKDRPKAGEELPETGEALSNAWSIGYNGSAYSPGEADERATSSTWHPTELRVGERVGVHVNNFGEVWVVHNDVHVDRIPEPVSVDTKLYPFIDLLGNTISVSIVPNASPPLPGTLKAFDKRTLSPYITLTEGVVARSSDPSPSATHGVLYGDAPLAESDKGFYFEVQIEQTRVGASDGLILGVTLSPPTPSAPPLMAADLVPNSWSIGYDGAVKVEGLPQLVSINGFDPTVFEVRDRIGFLVTKTGEIIEFRNDRIVTRFSATVPTDRPLFALVELRGKHSGVRLLPAAKIPENFKAKEQRAGGGAVAGGADGDSRPASGPSAPRGPAAPTGPPPNSMTGFDARSLHENVELSSGGLKVEHRDDSEHHGLFGVVIGNAPLAVREDGSRWFEVVVDSIREGPTDGLAIGVTETPPTSKFFQSKLPEVAEEVPTSWLAGYEGLFLDTRAKTEEQIVPIWNPATLALGHKVGVLVTKSGDFSVIANGKVVCNRKKKAPGPDKPLYALLDIIGRTGGVTFMPGSSPPETAKTFTAFDTELVSKQVAVLNNGLQISHKNKEPKAEQGGVFTNGVLPTFPEGEYFEVRVEALRPNPEDDGMVIGVTNQKPKPPWKVPEVMADYMPSWSAGYDGEANNNGVMTDISWSPIDLKVGDRVGLLVTPKREIWLLQGEAGADMEQKCRVPGEPPEGVPLYGFVDLLGMTLSLSLQARAAPPSGIEPAESSLGWLLGY